MLPFSPEETGLRAYDLASLVTSTETRWPNTTDFIKMVLLYTRRRSGLFFNIRTEQGMYGLSSFLYIFLVCPFSLIGDVYTQWTNINQGCQIHGPPRFSIWPATTFANDIHKYICIYYKKYIIFTHAAREPALTTRNFRLLPQSGWDLRWTEKLSTV